MTFVIRLFHIAISLLFIAAIAPAIGQNWINQLRSNSHSDKLQIVVDLAQQPSYTITTLDNPHRLVVDIQGEPSSEYENNLSFKNRGVSLIRTGMQQERQVRVVIEMLDNFRWRAFPLMPSKPYGHRIVVEVFDHPEKSNNPSKRTPDTSAPLNSLPTITIPPAIVELESLSSPTPTVGSKAPKKPATVVKTRPKPAKQPKASAQPPKKKATIAASTAKPAKRKTPQQLLIMIDPGHGGKDSGAIGPRKTKEKDIVLAISKKLKKKIDAIPGMKARLTRSSDRYISLRGRLLLAQKYKPDLFVSIHADSFVKPTASGSSVFILSNRGASSEAARWLAKRENAVDLKYGVDIGDYDKDVSNVLIQMQQDATIESSHVLAGKTLSKLKGIGKVHKRRVERAGFAVLKSPDIPSMLVETAFISNPKEEQKLRSSRYQNKLANAIASGIQNYFKARNTAR